MAVTETAKAATSENVAAFADPASRVAARVPARSGPWCAPSPAAILRQAVLRSSEIAHPTRVVNAIAVIWRPYRTLPNGTVLWAKDYGLKAWPITVRDEDVSDEGKTPPVKG